MLVHGRRQGEQNNWVKKYKLTGYIRYQPASRFEIVKPTPAANPAPAKPRPHPPAPVPPATPAAPKAKPQNHILETGKCEVSMQEGRLVVRDASYGVAVSIHNDAAFFMLTAPGKPSVCLSVLKLEVPIVYGTSCIVKTIGSTDQPLDTCMIKPLPPSTAQRLVQVLSNIQVALRKTLKLGAAPKPTVLQPSTPQPSKFAQAKHIAPIFNNTPQAKSLLCADSPDSSPEPSPRFRQSQLVEVTQTTQSSKHDKVNFDDVLDSISVTVRSALHRLSGSSMPMLATDSTKEQSCDVDAMEFLTHGYLDSDADEAKRDFIALLRFFQQMKLKRAAAREPPIMSIQTMELLKTIDRNTKSRGGSVSYSASELMHLKDLAIVPKQLDDVVPPGMKSKKPAATAAAPERFAAMPPTAATAAPFTPAAAPRPAVSQTTAPPTPFRPSPAAIVQSSTVAVTAAASPSTTTAPLATTTSPTAVTPGGTKLKKGLSSSMWAK